MQLPGIHFGLRRRMVAELHLVADAAVFVERHHVEPPVRPKPGQVVEVRTDVVDPNRLCCDNKESPETSIRIPHFRQ